MIRIIRRRDRLIRQIDRGTVCFRIRLIRQINRRIVCFGSSLIRQIRCRLFVRHVRFGHFFRYDIRCRFLGITVCPRHSTLHSFRFLLDLLRLFYAPFIFPVKGKRLFRALVSFVFFPLRPPVKSKGILLTALYAAFLLLFRLRRSFDFSCDALRSLYIVCILLHILSRRKIFVLRHFRRRKTHILPELPVLSIGAKGHHRPARVHQRYRFFIGNRTESAHLLIGSNLINDQILFVPFLRRITAYPGYGIGQHDPLILRHHIDRPAVPCAADKLRILREDKHRSSRNQNKHRCHRSAKYSRFLGNTADPFLYASARSGHGRRRTGKIRKPSPAGNDRQQRLPVTDPLLLS